MKDEYGWLPEGGCFTADENHLYRHEEGRTYIYRWDFKQLRYKFIAEKDTMDHLKDVLTIKNPTD